MSQELYGAFTVFLILCQTLSVTGAQTCLGAVLSVSGMILKGHIFNKTKVRNWPQCIKACNDDIRCQSFNYAIDEGICELNKRTKEAKPDDFVPARHRAYMTRSRQRAPLGSIPELPAESCDAIKASEGESGVSGNHWFMSVIPGEVFQAPCDMPEECLNYQNLTSGDRAVTSNNGLACDNSLGPAWFRFVGDAGSIMPTTCVTPRFCGTHAPGWLNGAHPTLAEGQVTRQVCFSWYNCCSWAINIKVRNCGDYFVYYLNGTPRGHPCNLRYCGAV